MTPDTAIFILLEAAEGEGILTTYGERAHVLQIEARCVSDWRADYFGSAEASRVMRQRRAACRYSEARAALDDWLRLGRALDVLHSRHGA